MVRKIQEDPMNVISVSAEIVPWSKTGGSGDVCGALPKAMVAKGHKVLTITPRYKEYPDAWDTGERYEIDGHQIGLYHCQRDGGAYLWIIQRYVGGRFMA